jgi:hypothetical protein
LLRTGIENQPYCCDKAVDELGSCRHLEAEDAARAGLRADKGLALVSADMWNLVHLTQVMLDIIIFPQGRMLWMSQDESLATRLRHDTKEEKLWREEAKKKILLVP